MTSISIRLKLLAAIIALCTLSAALGAYNLWQMSLVNEKASEIRDTWLPSVARAGSLNVLVKTVRTRQNRLAAYLVYFPDKLEEAAKQVRDTIVEADKAYDAYKPLIRPNSREAILAAEFGDGWDRLKKFDARVQVLVAEGKLKEAAQVYLIEATSTAVQIDKLLAEIMRLNEAGGATAANQARDVYGHAVILTLAAIGLAMLFGAGVAVGLVRSVVRPLGRSTAAVELLASGDTNVAIEGAERGDEIGVLARALDTFRKGMLRQRLMEREATEARERSEIERMAAQKQATARERDIVSRSIGSGLTELAARNMTFRLNEQLPEAYEKLQQDFNTAMDALESAMIGVCSGTNAISGGTQEIASAADDLSKRTEQQAASLEETAAALDQITASGRKAAEGAEHAREIVSVATKDAETTGDVVRKTVGAMGNIEKSAQQINQIIGVIDEIAFQTNLLALNAGVEAARAGESGRGFAVVASEVRALAQRSANAAKEIKALISTSTTQVAEGVELVAKTGKALERILAQVNDINKVVVDIAAGAQEQATGLSQVNAAINQMDQATQQNAAMVEQSTAASHSLAHEANKLAETIAQFRIGESANVVTMTRPSKPAAAAPKRTAMKHASSGSAAVAKSKPAPAAEEWSEF